MDKLNMDVSVRVTEAGMADKDGNLINGLFRRKDNLILINGVTDKTSFPTLMHEIAHAVTLE